MDSVDRLHGVSLEAGSPGEALESLVSDSLHRVHGLEAWVHNRCSLCMKYGLGKSACNWGLGSIFLGKICGLFSLLEHGGRFAAARAGNLLLSVSAKRAGR